MDMEILTAANDSWLQVSDGQILARPAAWFRDQTSAQSRSSAANLPQPLPMLNWPPTLFDDVRLHH
jgi:hypothetical protein